MNLPLPFGKLRQNLNAKINNVRESRFFHDRISTGLLIGALSVNGVNLVVLALHMPAVKADVPVRYSSLSGFEGLGPWYSPFLIALFGLAVTLVNGLLGYQSFTRSRLASFFLLAGAAVVGMFCLIISNAFAMVGQ